MSTRDERLFQFFGRYFHQDWDVEVATSWQDVIAAYAREVPREHAALLIQDLRSWVAEATAEGRSSLPATFRCGYDPRADGRWMCASFGRMFSGETCLTSASRGC
jgi:hypothetical protein